MSKRPYVWHVSKFDRFYKGQYPWSVTIGRPVHEGDWVLTAQTLPEAVEEALKHITEVGPSAST